MTELPIPPEASDSKRADELFRGWIIDNSLVCSLRPDFWESDPSQWGTLLADALHHVCEALAAETNDDKADLKRGMVESFMKEVRSPTGDHWGEFVD